MKLERGYFSVKKLAFGRGTSLADGVLTVDRDELVKTVLAEDRNGHIAALEPEIVVPGEDARIVHVLDTLAVGLKVSGEGDFLPGHLAAPTIVGGGKTHLLYAQYRETVLAGKVHCHVRTTRELVEELRRAESDDGFDSPVITSAYGPSPYHLSWDDVDKLK